MSSWNFSIPRKKSRKQILPLILTEKRILIGFFDEVARSLMKYVVTGVWLATIALGLPPLFGWNRYVYEVMRRRRGCMSPPNGQGYLFSSTVDFLSLDLSSLTYTWLLMCLGWIFPNIFIIFSHIFVCLVYRSVSVINH